MSYLIDTNVISELVRQKPDLNVQKWFDKISSEHIYLSVLTIGELRKGIEQVSDSKKKDKLRIWLEEELPQWFGERVLAVDQAVAERWGRLLAQCKRPMPAIDSLIAATALHFDLFLVTRNATDFNFPSLEIINPWED